MPTIAPSAKDAALCFEQDSAIMDICPIKTAAYGWGASTRFFGDISSTGTLGKIKDILCHCTFVIWLVALFCACFILNRTWSNQVGSDILLWLATNQVTHISEGLPCDHVKDSQAFADSDSGNDAQCNWTSTLPGNVMSTAYQIITHKAYHSGTIMLCTIYLLWMWASHKIAFPSCVSALSMDVKATGDPSKLHLGLLLWCCPLLQMLGQLKDMLKDLLPSYGYQWFVSYVMILWRRCHRSCRFLSMLIDKKHGSPGSDKYHSVTLKYGPEIRLGTDAASPTCVTSSSSWRHQSYLNLERDGSTGAQAVCVTAPDMVQTQNIQHWLMLFYSNVKEYWFTEDTKQTWVLLMRSMEARLHL